MLTHIAFSEANFFPKLSGKKQTCRRRCYGRAELPFLFLRYVLMTFRSFKEHALTEHCEVPSEYLGGADGTWL